MVFEHDILNIKLSSKKISNIGRCISCIYDEKIKIPTLSKFIIDPNHSLGISFVNIVSILANIDIVYLFNNALDNLNKCGIRLVINDKLSKKFITYADIILFTIDDNSDIHIIENPKYSDKHYIIPPIDLDKCGISSDILAFCTSIDLLNDIKLHTNIHKTFPDYTIKNNIKDAIENSEFQYKNNLRYRNPMSMWGIIDSNDINCNDIYNIYIRFNHYFDINKNYIKNFINKIFDEILDIFQNTKIDKIIDNYENKLIYSDITIHEKNYNHVKVQDNIARIKMEAICNLNDIYGINGNYLIPIKEELIDSEMELYNNMVNVIEKIKIHISEYIDNYDYTSKITN